MLVGDNDPPYAGHADAIRWIAGIGASLSLAGSLVIILSTLLFRDFSRSIAWRLIFFLSFADGIASLAYIIHMTTLDRYDFVCLVEAFLMNTFELSSVLWSSAICAHLLIGSLLGSRRRIVSRMEPVYHIVAWMLPLLWTGILLTQGRLGRASNWCWLVPDSRLLGYRFFTFLPIYVSLCFNLTCYLAVCVVLRSMHARWKAVLGDRAARREMRALLRLGMFTVAFFICWTPPFANRLAELFGHRSIVLMYAQAVINPLLGFINVIVYGLTTPRFFARYRMLLTCNRDAEGYEEITDHDSVEQGWRMVLRRRQQRQRQRRIQGCLGRSFWCCLCGSCCNGEDAVGELYGASDDESCRNHLGTIGDNNNHDGLEFHQTPRQLISQAGSLARLTTAQSDEGFASHSSPMFYLPDHDGNGQYALCDSLSSLGDSEQYSTHHGDTSSSSIVVGTYQSSHFFSPGSSYSTYPSTYNQRAGGASLLHNILRHGKNESSNSPVTLLADSMTDSMASVDVGTFVDHCHSQWGK